MQLKVAALFRRVGLFRLPAILPLPKTLKIMQTTSILRRGSFHLLSGTLISRASGLVRDLYTALCFGADPAIAAFFIAFRLSSFFRRFIAESSLSVGFIPHFEALRSQSEKQAILFFFDLTATLLALSLFLCVASGMLGLAFTDPLQEASVWTMTLTMLPSLGVIALYALFMSFLNCFRRYFLSALAPISFNILFIATLYFTRTLPREEAAYALCLAVLAGYLLQWALLIPSVYKQVAPFLTRSILRGVRCVSHPVRALLGSWSLTLLGVGAVQINGLCDMAIARYVSLEGPAYLTYAIRIAQAPLALFGIAIASALMPPLARAIATKAHKDSSELFSVALTSILTLLIPCSVWLTMNVNAIVELLYGYNQFSSEAVKETALCLAAYAVGLVPSAAVLLLAGAFYAKKNYTIPTKASVLSILLNLMINFFFVFALNLGTVSVALGTSLAACGNGLYLLYALKKEGVPELSFKEFIPSLLAILAACGAAFWVMLRMTPLFFSLFAHLPTVMQRLFSLGTSFLLFSLTFALVVYALGFKHLLWLDRRKTAAEPSTTFFDGNL